MSDVAEVRQLGQPYNTGSLGELTLVYIIFEFEFEFFLF